MPDVFISYKREERARCEPIYEKLKALGLDVWFDDHLTPGKDFTPEIERALRTAKAVIVLWSPASVASGWVRDEANDGKKRDVLAAIRIAPCDPPLGFGGTHYEDIHEVEFANDHPAWLKILARVGDLAGRPELIGYSKASHKATATVARKADHKPVDSSARKMRHLNQPVAQGRSVTSVSTPTLSRSVAAWTVIESSIDADDYAEFQIGRAS